MRRGNERRLVTARDRLTLAGRVALWCVVALVMFRGLSATFHKPVEPAPAAAQTDAVQWPDANADGQAAAYARAYFEAAAKEAAGDEKPTAVVDSSPAGHVATGTNKAKVFVHLVLRDPGQPGTRTTALAVPMAKDANGSRVDGTPSIAPAPRTALSAPPDSTPSIGESTLDGPDRDELAQVITRYVTAYLAGDARGLEYLAVPGLHPVAAGGWKVLGVPQIYGDAPASKGWLVVSATASDHADARVAVVFDVLVERRDGRWYVGGLR